MLINSSLRFSNSIRVLLNKMILLRSGFERFCTVKRPKRAKKKSGALRAPAKSSRVLINSSLRFSNLSQGAYYLGGVLKSNTVVLTQFELLLTTHYFASNLMVPLRRFEVGTIKF